MSTDTPLTPVAFVDLLAQHAEIADEVERGFARVLATGAFIGGPDVREFESEFSAYCGTAHCIGVANGTDAIETGLRAAGIGVGDEVVVPANTFIATAEAVVRTGASLVLVDCYEETMLLDPSALPDVLTARTRAVIGVDLYGQIAPFDAMTAAVGGDVMLIEDAAQSQGASRHGNGVGHGVSFAATSFYPGKNLGAYGDAGAVVTNDEALAEDVRAIGNHGGTKKYEHRLVGTNSRLDTLQAVVLRAKLRRLDAWNEARRRAAERYREAFAQHPGIVVPLIADGNVPVWHLYPVRVPDRQRTIDHLSASGVGCGIHYPLPVHLTEAFAFLGMREGAFPRSEAAARTMVSLPMHPHLSTAEQDLVIALVLESLS